MKKIIVSVLLLAFFIQNSYAQSKPIRERGIGVSFILNDFVTPQRIRTSTLSAVLRDKRVAKFREMNPGLAITYFKGVTPKIDFTATLGGSFVNLPLATKSFNRDNLLLEVDAAANFKMFPETAKVNAYLIAGIGVSKYTSIYGAFLPLGGGIKLNLFNESQGYVQLQYRIPVTPDATNYHMQVSIGISGLLGKKRA